VSLVAKAGATYNTGSSPNLPSTDTGFSPLYLVTVSFGQGSISSSNISLHPNSVVPQFSLLQLRPGFSNQLLYAYNTATPGGLTWQPPPGVTLIRLSLWGGGGAGGNGGGAGYAGGGGGGGAFLTQIVAVNPDVVYSLNPGPPGAQASAQGTNGGNTAFEFSGGGILSQVDGGFGGGNGSGSGGGSAGNGGSVSIVQTSIGTAIAVPGFNGGQGAQFSSFVQAGFGGSCNGQSGPLTMPQPTSTNTAGFTADNPGAGGAGGVGTGVGGSGSPGQIMIEY
jgi:hypothetical protein